MQFSTIFAIISSLLISSASAQTACDSIASAIPTCGVPCIHDAAIQVGCPETNPSDYSCRCSHASAIQSSAINCVISACGFLNAIQVASGASSLCGCVATATPAPTSSATAATATTTSADSEIVVTAVPRFGGQGFRA